MNLESFTNQERTLTNLPALSEINRLNQWIYEKIEHYTKGSILEVVSGNGGMSSVFIQQRTPLSLSDPEERYCKSLRNKFSNEPTVAGIHRIDLLQEDFEVKNVSLLGSFDTVFSLNVAEHTPINKMAVSNANKLLAPGGYLIAYTPVYTALYNELDPGFNHWHRHNKEIIKNMLPKTFEIIKMRYFNLIGIVGRFLSGYRLGGNADTLAEPTMFHELVPLFQIEDLAFKHKGLSTIVVAQKK
jgi:2-polyprenyl-3-methyl-5-hydroxy-6-metoxy-1,4-benzoquinol methylase